MFQIFSFCDAQNKIKYRNAYQPFSLNNSWTFGVWHFNVTQYMFWLKVWFVFNWNKSFCFPIIIQPTSPKTFYTIVIHIYEMLWSVNSLSKPAKTTIIFTCITIQTHLQIERMIEIFYYCIYALNNCNLCVKISKFHSENLDIFGLWHNQIVTFTENQQPYHSLQFNWTSSWYLH